jgi:hypothetical protein
MSIKTLPNDDRDRLGRIGMTGPDTPVSLKEACERYFSGSISVATLKAEHRRGTLEIYKIGRQYFTTLNQIRAMMEKCCLRSASPREPSNSPDDWNDNMKNRAALAAARLVVEKLKTARKKKVT